jgi:uncharacterized membrane protein
MLDIALFAFFAVMAYRIAQSVRREAHILAEFKQPQTLGLLVLLFPLGPLVLLVGSLLTPFPVAHIAAVFCYLPALIGARRQARALETAGTDRVQRAQTAISQAFGTALVGLGYVAVVFALAFGVRAIGQGA